MSNANEALLQKLINDPSLLKLLEKMAKAAPAEKKVKKMKELGNPTYVNCVTLKCKLCGSEHTKYLCMVFDPEEKLYRTSCHATENLWPDLPVYTLRQRTTSCAQCPGILLSLEKETLVQKLINLANVNHTL